MAHELNELAPGIHSYAGAREHAWHRLGVTLDSTMTAEEALAAAHLVGWDVRKVALKTEPIIGPNGVTVLDIPDRFATVYTNPLTGEVRYLGTVGSHYDPTQNEESTDLLQAVTDLSGAIFETAGSLRGGKETFVTIRLPETMLVGGKDPVGLYLAALNSHDGSSAQRCIVTPVRILCANTQAAALTSARASFSIRHTKGSKASAVEARRALGLTFKYIEEFQAEADRMIEQEITDAEFARIAAELFGGGEAASTRQKNVVLGHLETLTSIWKDDPAQTMAGIQGTRWGAYQAITEYADFWMPVRGGESATARANRSVQSQTIATLKTQAFKTLSLV